MKTILVDDERYGLERFELECSDLTEIDLIGKFRSPYDALEFAKANQVELAFLDIEMPGMNGLDLADKLHKINHDVIIIFISAYEQYMPDAFRSRNADYYIVKPYTKDDVKAVCERAKLLSRRFAKRIYIETFGYFNIYLDGKAIKFTSDDAKELLALLVNKRGTALSNQNAFYSMWEDRSYDHANAVSLHKAWKKLKDTLNAAGIGDLVMQVQSNEHRINTDLFDCDYYQFLEGKPEAIRKYNYEYMSEWTWGEETTGYLTRLKDSYEKSIK